MNFRRSDRFSADYRKLSSDERALFLAALRKFGAAADLAVQAGAFNWPASLRVKGVRAARGVYEMTWSFSGPDGRATWEWISVADPKTGEKSPAIRLRRVGDHSIFKRP